MRYFFLSMILFSNQFLLSEEKPQILIIGDSLYNEPTRQLAKSLKGVANVQYSKYGKYNTTSALKNFDKLLMKKKWDVIHFNFGFNDLMYKAPDIKEIRALHKDAGGVHATPLKKYEENLQGLVEKFKSTGAKIIWASTTPIVGDNGILVKGDEVLYNKVAFKVMKKNKIAINDMYNYGLESHKKMKRGHPKTFNYKGGLAIHLPILNHIKRVLAFNK